MDVEPNSEDTMELEPPSECQSEQYTEKQNNAAKMIQRNFRRYFTTMNANSLLQRADNIQINQNVVKELDQENLKLVSQQLTEVMQKIPYNLWVQIFQYIPEIRQIINLSYVCKLFNDIVQVNMVWYPTLKYTFPRYYEEEFKEQPKHQIDWKNHMIQKTLQYKGLKDILKLLIAIKEEGNELFKQKEIDLARQKYMEALNIIFVEKYDLSNYENIIGLETMVEYFRIKIQLFSNAALMHKKLDNYFKCRAQAKSALRLLFTVKETLNNYVEEELEAEKLYEDYFQKLEDKVRFRIKSVEEEMPIPFHFYHHSDVPVNELRVGSMLAHNDRHFGGGIFSQSKVIMTTFNRDSSDITGVIINKTITLPNGEVKNIGGPCEQSRQLTLHNVPNIEGATKVVEGVWLGGEVDQYRNNNEHIVKDYYGYASWFSGQLDGEIRDGDGWQHTNLVTPADILEPQNPVQMPLQDLY